jgi:hypothetical protein
MLEEAVNSNKSKPLTLYNCLNIKIQDIKPTRKKIQTVQLIEGTPDYNNARACLAVY